MKHLALTPVFLLTLSTTAHGAWQNSVEAGYSKSSGNSDVEALYLAGESQYTHNLYSAGAKLKLDQQNSNGLKTKDYRLIEAKAKQFFKETKDFYGYGNAQWEQDEPSGLENNWVVTIGPGYQWQWPEKITLSVEIGAGYQSTDYQDDTKDFQGCVGRFFAGYVHPLNKVVTFKADTRFLYDEVRTRNTSNLNVESALLKNLSLSAGYEYRYNSKPDGGKKEEDTSLRLTLKYTF